ncbi:spore germination protein [Bacillus sp. PS06]|uniref:spore germination protein n=1 Tax=Bacillus sp. PS06 TaxID=2764176 RepID=UPI00177F806B|nr:spore germination protein [Bacillus sp. PS06]MBD8068044.1 spore germination protein [Bacillus sp. PS06]
MNNRGTFFKRRKNKQLEHSSTDEMITDIKQEELSFDLTKNKELIKKAFGNTMDFKIEEVTFGDKAAIICYIDTMVAKNKIVEQVFKPLESVNAEEGIHITEDNFEQIRKAYFAGLSFTYCKNYHQIIWHILSGFIVIVIDGIQANAFALEVINEDRRSIDEPSTQTIIRGPKEGFTELLSTNISLIRRRLKNHNLQFENYIIGKESKTSIALGYIDGITNKDILNEVRERINKIDASLILDSGNIEEFIVDKTLTPFPLTFNTERPDSTSAQLAEGKVVLIVDGSPFVIVVPTVFTDFFQATEDYYQPFFMATFIRIIRYMSFMIALVLPSLYVALTTFHQELLPTELLISIQAQREGVPFPAVVEIFMMELTFEVLREAGIRMPRAVGQTVSIVGALVLGQAAVEAGLVSNVLVIIVAFTAIASFVSPIYNFSIATRLLRFILILAAASLGLYGVLLGLVIMVIHLTSLRSFGISYLTPVAPLLIEDQTDVFVRLPIWANKKRPSYLKTAAPIKKEHTNNPSPPTQSKGDQE